MFEGTPLEVGVLFGFGGTPKTHGRLAKEEFGVGWDHMLHAASHAAGGVGSAIGPRAHAMRSMITPAAGRVRNAASTGWGSTVSTVTPLMAAAREGAREATEAALKEKAKLAKLAKLAEREERMNQRRIGMAVGLLAAGVAVGAAAALVMRRRRRSTWEEYDPSQALESVTEPTADMLETAGDKAAAKASQLGEKTEAMGDRTKATADQAANKIDTAGKRTAEETSAFADDLTDTPANSRMRRS
jgi:hypothetical protein